MNEDKLEEIRSYFDDDFEINLDMVRRYSDYNSIPRLEHQLFFETNEDEFPRFIGENPDSFFVAIPYCAKPENCPEERDSDDCTPDCEVDCPLKEIHLLTKELGSDFFIIRSDDEYIQYIIHKKEKIKDGTLYQLTWGCPLTMMAFIPLVAGIGTRGIGIELTGPVCDKSSDYTHSIESSKRKRTFLGDISAAESYLKKAIVIKKQRCIGLDLTVDMQKPSPAEVNVL